MDMNTNKKRKMRHNNIRGFSLIEVMVSLAIVSLVMATLVGVFARSNQVYTLQNSTVALQQELRAAMEIMVMEIRMAGYNPLNVKGDTFGIQKAERGELRFTVDWDGDIDESTLAPGEETAPGEVDTTKNPTGECEDRTFRYRAGTKEIQMICNDLGGVHGAPFTLIGGGKDEGGGLIEVTDFQFEYLEGSKITTAPTQRDWIKGLVITMSGRIPAGSQNEPVERTYKTFVALRNK